MRSIQPFPANLLRRLGYLIVLVLCPVCGILSYHLAFAGYKRSQVNVASQGLASEATTLHSLLAQHELLPRLLALDLRVVSAIEDPRRVDAISSANSYLEEMASKARVLAAYLMDGQGNTIAASNWNAPASFIGNNYAFRSYFQDAVQSGGGRSYAVGSTTGEPGYFVSAKVQSPSGAKGVVVVKLSLNTTLQPLGGERPSLVAMVDEFGVVFLSSHPSILYRPVEPLSEPDLAKLQATRRYGGHLSSALFPMRLVPGQSATMQVSLDGQQGAVQPIWDRIDGSDWRLVSFVDLQPARAAGWVGALGGALGSALAVSLTMYARLRRVRASEIEQARNQLSQSEARLRAVVDSLPVMVCFIDPREHYVFANTLYSKMYERSATEIEGRPLSDVLEPAEYAIVSPQLKRALSGEVVVFELETGPRRLHRCLEATCRPEWNVEKTVVTGVHVMTQDITQTKQRLRELALLSQLDHLTGLLNRRGFEAKLQAALAEAASDDSFLCLLFIDLNGFKSVNDTYGHAAGDAVLTVFAKRLHQLVRANDVVARLGGDEFAVLIPAMASINVAEGIAKSIIQMSQHPFSIDGTTVSISASVGVAYQRHGEPCSATELCRSADAYLYDAKKRDTPTFTIGAI